MTTETTTLRDIITEDLDALWRDNNGDIWDGSNILEQWGADLDKPASCLDGQVRYYDEHGYVTGAEAVLTEINVNELVDDVLYALAQATDNDSDPGDAELATVRTLITDRLTKMAGRSVRS